MTNKKDIDEFILIAGVGVFLICIILWIGTMIQPASAIVAKSGWDFGLHTKEVLPDKSYVHQGDNISQGRTYDLTGVYGFSGKLAHWTYDDDEMYKKPDIIYNLNDGNPRTVLISPSVFPIGWWYQWDGTSCDNDEGCIKGSGHGNTRMFYVVPYEDAPVAPAATITQSAQTNISVFSLNGVEELPAVVPIPVTTVVPSTPENVVTIVIPDPTTIFTPPPTVGIDVVTPRTPVSIVVPIFALLFAGGIVWRRK